MKVMLLSPFSVGGERGDMMRMFRIVKALLHRGHEVFILAPDFKIGKGYKFFVVGRKLIDKVLITIQLLFLYPIAYVKFKPDVILTRTPLFSLIASFYKMFNKKPLIVDSFMPYPKDVIRKNPRLRLQYMPYKLSVNHIDLFTVENEVFYGYVVENGAPEHKVFILPPGISLSPTPPVFNKRLIYVSFFYKNDKFEMFLKKLADVKKVVPDFRLDIYGYGPEELKYKQIVKSLGLNKNVKFLGRVSNEKIRRKIPEYHACLLMDTAGQKAYEYLSYGKPILAIKSNFTECVLDGAALLAKDVDEHIKNVRTILLSKRLTKLYASKSKQLAKERYEIGYVSEKFDRALRNIISKTN